MSDTKVVLITGCSSGIGRDLALEFKKHDFRVFASARNLSAIQDLADKEGMDIVQLDVTKPESIQSALDEIHHKAEKIDILVNNAGVSSYVPAVDQPLQEVRDVMETNFFGVIALTQAVLNRFMIPARSGKIVQISSIVGEVTPPWFAVYGASKAAITHYSDALRVEVAPFGIKVVIVKPGSVKSNIANSRSHTIDRLANNTVYAPIWENFLERGNSLQAVAVPADEFAKDVVSKVLQTHPPENIIGGTNSFKLWVMAKVSSYRSDQILSKIYGLDKLKAIVSKEK